MDVALHAAQLGSRLFRPAHRVRFIGQIKQKAADGNQALAHFGGEVAFAANRAENLVIAAIGSPAFRFEYVMGDLIDLPADALQNVGRAVDDGIKQVHQHRFPAHRRRADAAKLVADDHEWARLFITNRYQPVPGQYEGDRSSLWVGGISLTHQSGGHVARPILHIESTGNFDLLHFLAGRDCDADLVLDDLVFLGIRIDQVVPDGAVRYVFLRRDGNALERGVARNVSPEHHPSASSSVSDCTIRVVEFDNSPVRAQASYSRLG